MQFEDIKDEVTSILEQENGRFLSAYQICQKLEKKNEPIWQKLTKVYPSINITIPMGEGTGKHYSPASFVGNSLSHFVRQKLIANLEQRYFGCEGVKFEGIEPGFTGNEVGIWAINNGRVS
ncbi:MAG: hypothetical protein HOO97_10825 [Sideroxydans sp.]|nr:hypothetical protein [Sideroxydans sp.]